MVYLMRDKYGRADVFKVLKFNQEVSKQELQEEITSLRIKIQCRDNPTEFTKILIEELHKKYDFEDYDYINLEV